MKYPVSVFCLWLAACQPSSSGSKQQPATNKADAPQAGIVVAADSMRIADPVNVFYFAVSIVTTEFSYRGTYDVLVHYGPNDARTQISFPNGGKEITPVLKKDDAPYSYTIGFHYADDPAFYDYFQVKATKGTIKMKYLKGYSFE